MKKVMIAAAAMLMCGSAFAQTTTGPAAQTDTSNKPGMSAPTNAGGSTMGKESTTTGMKKDSMSQGGASKDGQGQANKGGMSK